MGTDLLCDALRHEMNLALRAKGEQARRTLMLSYTQSISSIAVELGLNTREVERLLTSAILSLAKAFDAWQCEERATDFPIGSVPRPRCIYCAKNDQGRTVLPP